jgi:dynein heavy chain
MDEKTRNSCSELLQYFHSTTIKWAETFYNKLRRKYYVTPISYLEMISSFLNLLAEKRDHVMKDRNKYDKGYDQIITTEKKIEEMQENLTAL